MPADTIAQSMDFFTKLQPGLKLAGCYLLQKHVEGTACPLWLAHDEVLGKDISLLFLPPGILARSGIAERLRQEVKRARQIVHPRVLRVHDLIEEEEWSAIAMDTFRSRPLSAVIAGNARGCFDVADVWPLARDLCAALDDAHHVRAVHGGLSPDDVLVGEGEAKLMNFGVSACLRDAAEDSARTAFASAQQLGGTAATGADDVFAVGALLHTLLAGGPPFSGKDRNSAPSIAAHRQKLNRRGGDLPQAWERVIASCLSQDPAARPASCADIAKQLDPGAPAAASAEPERVEAPVVAPKVVAEQAPEAPAKPVVEKSVEPAVEQPVETSSKPVVEHPVEAPASPVAEQAAAIPVKVEEPVLEVLPPVRKESPAATPEHEPPGRRVERRVKMSGASDAAPAERIDPDELAAKVRAEEAREQGRGRGGFLEEEIYVGKPPGSGPSVVSVLSILAVTGLVGFILYRLFVSDSATSVSTEPSPFIEPATPAALATPAKKMSLATPTPASPRPSPVALVTPKPVTPMVEPPKVDDTAIKIAAAAEQQKKLETAIVGIKQTIEKTGKDLPAAKKAIDELGAQQTKLADDVKKAELAAQQAEKVAADTKKLADDTRKAATAAAEQLAAKKAEVTRSDDQLAMLAKDLSDTERALADAKKAAEDAAKKAMAAVTPTPAPLATPKPGTAATPDDPRAAFEQKMKELTKVLGASATKVPVTPPPVEMAKATTPKPGAATPAPDATKTSAATGFTNSLGVGFVPVAGTEVIMAIWPTRVRDFEGFAKTTGLKSSLWKDPGFKQTPEHPVVNVTWQEALAFCKWLTIKEQKEGLISAKQSYRLPTDLEWSRAAGLGTENGATPEARDMGVPDMYPWGKTWPPPSGSGNYTGEETGSDVAIKGYNDGFMWTSPVGSFPASKLGLFDMGGNVWQWCMDSWNTESKAKVLRGASWYNGALKLSLLSSCRVHAAPDSSTDNYGFRVVLTLPEK
ncbi:MAG: SUMF1/EgtB/PvdO family nonheme iron enzyme [Chthoniobacteraceae bacterium]